MQINKFLSIIHKLVNVVYEKTAYEDTIFISEKSSQAKRALNNINLKNQNINMQGKRFGF